FNPPPSHSDNSLERVMKNSSAYACPVPVICGKNIALQPFRFNSLVVSMLELGGALAVSLLSAWCVTASVSLMFEWGYGVVKALFGQPESSQAVIAGMSLWFLVMPFSFALVFGYVKQTRRRPQFWNFVPAIVVAWVATFDLMLD